FRRPNRAKPNRLVEIGPPALAWQLPPGIVWATLLVGNLTFEYPTAAVAFSTRRTVVSHYKSNVRDQEFNLFEVFGIDRVFGAGPYPDLDVATVREMLAEMSRLA